jgi:hypothetical protein
MSAGEHRRRKQVPGNFYGPGFEAVLLSGLPACYLAQLSSNSMKCLPDLFAACRPEILTLRAYPFSRSCRCPTVPSGVYREENV